MCSEIELKISLSFCFILKKLKLEMLEIVQENHDLPYIQRMARTLHKKIGLWMYIYVLS